MDKQNINIRDIIFSLDIGTRSIIGTVGIIKDKKFNVIAESYVEHEKRAMIDGQIHDINLVSLGVSKVKKELEEKIGLKLNSASIAAAGRFLRTTTVKTEMDTDYNQEIDKDTIRSLELTAVKVAKDEIKKDTGGKLYCVGYSVKSYFLNGYIISNLLSQKGDNIGCELIATFLPRSVVDSLYAVMNKVNLKVNTLTLEPIAAIEAAVPSNLRLLNIALVDVGAGTSDIAISSKDSIVAYGMVSKAGDEITEIIAQNYLVDFNTAERIKIECSKNSTITYIDALGFESEITSEEVIKLIVPMVDKITKEIGEKIIELNGGKAPNAVFLVGGGAHTPLFKEKLAEKLNLPLQRVGIKGRESVTECVTMDNNLGSIGVTVLGIAMVAIKNSGHDFIDVTLNGRALSLFNSHKRTVMDVMLQGGINPSLLIGKNGKSIRFVLNNINRVAFGYLGKGAVIKINGSLSNIDAEVKEGDNIEITFAKDGEDANPKVLDYAKVYNSISFYLDGKIKNIEPIAFINDKRVLMEEHIKEGDTVTIFLPNTLEEYLKYYEKREGISNYNYYLNDKLINFDYIIKEGDKIFIKEQEREVAIDKETEEIVEDKIIVIVNGSEVKLKGKKEWVFIDIFNFYEFDLTKAKGNLVLNLNGTKAAYHDKLKAGDQIEIYWQ